MPDMLGTGLSSLRALQRALDTTAHNIANVSTPGYSRQRVEFETRKPSVVGLELDRQWRRRQPRAPHLRPVPDRADPQQQRQSRAPGGFRDAGRAARQHARRHDQRLCRPRCRPSRTRSAKCRARRDPFRRARCCSPRPRARRSACRTTTIACATCRPTSTRASPAKRAKSRCSRRASRASTAKSRSPPQNTGQPPNDLLDQRDRLIDELASKVSVTTVADGDRTLNVFIGNGQPLVLGTTASRDHHGRRSVRSGAHAVRA